MRLLLDTDAFIWLAAVPGRLSPSAREAISDPANTCLLSPLSTFEIAQKVSRGKLSLAISLPELLRMGEQAIGLLELPLRHAHATGVAYLPWHHKDPFDRLIIAQALSEDLTVVSSDRIFETYGVTRIW